MPKLPKLKFIYLSSFLLLLLAGVGTIYYQKNSSSTSSRPPAYKYKLIGNISSLDGANKKLVVTVYQGPDEKVDYNVEVKGKVFIFDEKEISFNDLKAGDQVNLYSNRAKADLGKTFTAEKVSKIDNSILNNLPSLEK